MIPIKDDNPTSRFPFVTILILLINVAVFVYQWMLGPELQAFIFRYGAIPWEIVHFREYSGFPDAFYSELPGLLTVFSAMFIHGGLLHLLGNMIYLWVFADNIEAILGHGRFLLFYMICGCAAAFTHIVLHSESLVPMVGASGAISGILGAYLVRFPRTRVHVLIFFFFFIRIVRVPSVLLLGFWFIIQVFSGLGGQGVQSGVAWFAHIGGFLTGVLFILIFPAKKRVRIRQPLIPQ
jgi:membrane associated rhomboid family serine protease